MEKFKVLDPKGIFVDGKLAEKGNTVTIGKGATLNAFLHFKQVEAVKAKAEDPEAESKAAAEKEKAEAEAKAKAEAESKGKK
jgi:hypothetical protein